MFMLYIYAIAISGGGPMPKFQGLSAQPIQLYGKCGQDVASI